MPHPAQATGCDGSPRTFLPVSRQSYQRGSRRRWWSPPPEDLLKPPPPPDPFGWASFTFNARPLQSRPFSSAIANAASEGTLISTHANPRERPVSRSVTTLTRSIAPYGSNNALRSLSVVEKSKLPTKMFFILLLYHSAELLAGRTDLLEDRRDEEFQGKTGPIHNSRSQAGERITLIRIGPHL